MRKQAMFRAAWIITIVVIFSLSCNLVTQINETRQMATEMDLGGLATELSPELISTEILPLMTDMDIEGLLTEMPLLDDTSVAATPVGFPPDIPVMPQGTDMKGTPTSLEYSVDGDVQEAVDFYRREMVKMGWAEVAGGKVESTQATLSFQKGNRKASIAIEEDFLGSLVAITLQGS